MRVLWIWFSVLILLATACNNDKPTESPLKNLKKGLWVPIKESPKSISKRLIDAPDSIRSVNPPLWLVGDATDVLIAKQDIFFTHSLYAKEGDWFVETYDCSINTTKEGRLICTFVDAEGENQKVEYEHVISESSLPEGNLIEHFQKTTWFLTEGGNVIDFKDENPSVVGSLLAVFRDSVNQVVDSSEDFDRTKLTVFETKDKLLFLTIDPLNLRESFVIKALNKEKSSLSLINLATREEVIWRIK